MKTLFSFRKTKSYSTVNLNWNLQPDSSQFFCLPLPWKWLERHLVTWTSCHSQLLTVTNIPWISIVLCWVNRPQTSAFSLSISQAFQFHSTFRTSKQVKSAPVFSYGKGKAISRPENREIAHMSISYLSGKTKLQELANEHISSLTVEFFM